MWFDLGSDASLVVGVVTVRVVTFPLYLAYFRENRRKGGNLAINLL